MKIGHICLAADDSAASDRFAAIVEALAAYDVEQHVLVAGVRLARRLAHCKKVTVGPIVRSPLMAYCLMPKVGIAHMHDSRSAQAGLLLALTRSIPFVLTDDADAAGDRSPVTRSLARHAAGMLQSPYDGPASLAAREHLNVYENALAGRSKLPENADRRQ